MSQENVDLTKQALAAYARRDLETLRTVVDPDMELDWSASGGWFAGVYKGVEETLRFYADYFEAFEKIVIEADRFIDAGESVVVPNVAYQTGRDGITVSARSTFVFTLRAGKIIRVRLYQEEREAIEAVGLVE
jgi:ketosteroid isomerase-like protein